MNKESALLCENCGGKLDVDPNKTTAVCPFCGSCFSVSGLLSESDEVTIERIRRDVEYGRQNVELAQQNNEAQRIRQAESEAIRNDSIERAKRFKKSGLSKVTMIFAVISILVSIAAFAPNTPFHSAIVGIVAAIQALLYLVTFFLGMQVIPEKGKNLHILSFVIGALLIIPFSISCVSCVGSNTGISEKNNTFSWDEIVLIDKIPVLDSEKGNIITNTNSELWLDVYEISIKQYYSFVENCKSMGYTTESEEDDKSFSAFDQNGYELSLNYWSANNGSVYIKLNSPKKLIEFKFPDSKLANLIPVPKSNLGNIVTDSDTRFMINVGNTPIEDFNAYVDECAENGFSIEPKRTDKLYSAKNIDKFELGVTYEGNGLITITVNAPKKEIEQSSLNIESKPINSSSTQETPSTPILDQTLIRPEIKQGLDSYAAFMDEYIAFMKKYRQSSNPLTMLTEYSKYLEKLEEFEEKWDNIDDSNWTDAETAYYAKVMTEISAKLLQVF